MAKKYQAIMLDMSNIFYRSYYANTKINKNGKDVGAIIAAMSMLHSYYRKYEPEIFIGVFDGKGGSKRKRKIYSEYKNNRSIPIKTNIFTGTIEEQQKKCHENFLWQLTKLHELLTYLPLIRITDEGYEADELIGYLSNKILENKTKLIVSNDKDYHQLINDKCDIYDHKNIITQEEIKNIWGTDVGENIVMMRCMIGDVSDNVSGIKGLGLKTIQKYFPFLNENIKNETTDIFYESLNSYIESIKDNKKDKTKLKKCQSLIEDNNKLILERNHELMQLKDVNVSSDITIEFQNIINEKQIFDYNNVKQFLIKEDINIDNKLLDSWKSTFNIVQYKNMLNKK